MKLMHGVIFAVFAAGCRTILAATLMLNYDASDPESWVEGVLKDTVGKGERLVASGGKEGAEYGEPVYVAEGAGPAGRAYLDFQKFGMLTGSNAQGGMLNNPEATKPATGYTMETYVRISLDARVKDNAGIGAHNSTSYQNQFINLQKADKEGSTELISSTALWDGTGPDMELPEEERGPALEKHYFAQENKLEDFIPRDEWVHVVKVHDPETNGGQIRWYLNGKLAGTFDFSAGAAGDRYPDRGDGFGDVGEPSRPWDPGDRTIMGLGFALFRLYQGVLSEQEIAARFEEVTKPAKQ
jgi:hypothetical protein